MNDHKTHTRIYGLDILRAVAIFYVMLSHGSDYSNGILDVKYYNRFTLDGVGLFFVLSGFLIGGILLRTINDKEFTARELFRFWARRWFRTLPAYYLVLAILVVCYYAAHAQLPPFMLRYFAFTQCLAWPHPLFFGEAWSLAVEEWFYLLIPAALFMLLRFTKDDRRSVLSLIIVVLIAGTAFRVFKVSQYDHFADDTYGLKIGKEVVTRLDGIMYGVLGAWLGRYQPEMWLRYKRPAFFTGVVILFGINWIPSWFFYGYFYYSLTSIGVLCLLPALSSLKSGKGLVFRAVTFISIVSYSMYLTNHMIVHRAVMPRLLALLHVDPQQGAIHSGIALALFWVLTLVFSYLLYRFWEQPMMQLRDRRRS